MKKILQLILSLTLISAVCAAVLAIVNNATKERIANLATLKANNAARAVLPASVKAIEPVKDPADASLTAFIGYADDAKTQIAGYAVPGLTAKGYGGNIRLMVGLNPDRTVISYQVLAAAETPGLGSNLTTPAFIARFKDQPAASVKVTKDGGKIEALTSATITSRAVCDAVADAARRIDRIEGKDSATSAPAPAINPEGKLLFDPAKPRLRGQGRRRQDDWLRRRRHGQGHRSARRTRDHLPVWFQCQARAVVQSGPAHGQPARRRDDGHGERPAHGLQRRPSGRPLPTSSMTPHNPLLSLLGD